MNNVLRQKSKNQGVLFFEQGGTLDLVGVFDDTWCLGTKVLPLRRLVNVEGALLITKSVSSLCSY